MTFLRLFFFASVLTFGLSLKADIFSIPVSPEESITPGSFCGLQDIDFKGFGYSEKIPTCKRSLNEEIKELVYLNYQIPVDLRKCYSLDHFVPLFLGGNNAIENLWPKHHFVRSIHSKSEQKLFKLVLAGSLKVDEAVRIILDQKKNLQVVIPADFECAAN